MNQPQQIPLAILYSGALTTQERETLLEQWRAAWVGPREPVEITPVKDRPWTVPPELTDQIANMPPTLGMSPVKIVEIDPQGKTRG